ncbi:MAG: hypothetical protein ACI9EF_001996, partial [Pseudohongiellaceae bacterium]
MVHPLLVRQLAKVGIDPTQNLEPEAMERLLHRVSL